MTPAVVYAGREDALVLPWLPSDYKEAFCLRTKDERTKLGVNHVMLRVRAVKNRAFCMPILSSRSQGGSNRIKESCMQARKNGRRRQATP